jgi:hypothetical protein
MPLRTTVYDRNVLYDEVWREPARAVAKRYAISGVALAKICRKLRVPTPGRGYWAEFAVGKADPRPPLPRLAGEANDRLIVTRRAANLDLERIAMSLEEGRSAMGPPIIVPDKLGCPHPLIADAAEKLDGDTILNGIVLSDEQCIDIAASPALLERALRIMNTLLLALEERGMSVELTERTSRSTRAQHGGSNSTRVLVGDEWIRFGIIEHLKQYEPPFTAKPPKNLKGSELDWWRYMNRPRISLIPSGRLTLHICEAVGVRRSWRDGRRGIEDRLNEFIKQLFVVADAKKQARNEEARWREAFETEQRCDQRKYEREEREARRAATVREKLERWRAARDIRDLVAHVRASLAARSAQRLPSWLKWAERYADRLDPANRGGGATRAASA